MKNECDIVKDLLFSYNDGVLSKTSTEFVENHLKDCENCKNVLKEIKLEVKEKNEKKDIDIFKSIKGKMSKKNILIFISLIILLIVVIFNILVFKNYNSIASTMEIYLDDEITNEELENIRNTIIQNTENIEIEYVSKDDALNEVMTWDKEVENFLSEYKSDNKNNPMLAYFSIKTKSSSEIERISDIVSNMNGIKHINTYINYNPYELFLMENLEK